MSERGRSSSPRPLRNVDMDVDSTVTGTVNIDGGNDAAQKPAAKVIIVTNLTRNVVGLHLHQVFGFYGEITKIDLPIFGKCLYSYSLFY